MKQTQKWFLDRIGKVIYCKHRVAFTGEMTINNEKHARHLFEKSQEEGFEFRDPDAGKGAAKKVLESKAEEAKPEQVKDATSEPKVKVIDYTGKSSNISQVAYDAEHELLEVMFNSGKSYQYSPVPSGVFKELQNAESVGSFMNRSIIRNYTETRVLDTVFSIFK